jgi:hypothetical protein
MYNGIGLQTARGSGTNGYAQSNKFFVKPRSTTAGGGPGGRHKPLRPDAAGAVGGGMRKPNKEILEHDRKRQVELKLLVLRDALEEHGYTEDEIEERVAEARKAAEEVGIGRGAGRSPLPGRGYGSVGVI